MIADAVGAPLNDPNLVVESLRKAERDFVVGMAVTGDAVPVPLDHVGEFLKGSESAPAELRFPVVEKFSGPCGIFVVPQLPERFFQQVGFVESAIGLEQEPQRASAVQIEVGVVRQEGISLAFDESSVFRAHSLIFDAPDVVHRVGEMAKDVEFVVDDAGVGSISDRRGSEGLPHIHYGHLDFQASPADFPVENVHFLLAASLASHPDRPQPIQIADQDRIVVSLPNRHLVDADGSQTAWGWILFQKFSHVVHLDAPNLIPFESVHFGHTNQTHLPALATDDPFEPSGVPFR